MEQDHNCDVLTDLKARLDRRGIPYDSTDGGVRVRSAEAGGFDASITFDGDGCYVRLGGGWHEEFEDSDVGLDIFRWALSSSCRLAVTRRWIDHKWTLQFRNGDAWMDWVTTGLLFFPLFLPASTRYLQNHRWDGDPTKAE